MGRNIMAVTKVTPLCLSIFLLLFPKSQGSGMLERYRRDVGNECEFNRDCSELHWCKTIQDASCVCVLGNCTTTSHFWFANSRPPKECSTYKDCKCKGRPDNCFCREGRCDTNANGTVILLQIVKITTVTKGWGDIASVRTMF